MMKKIKIMVSKIFEKQRMTGRKPNTRFTFRETNPIVSRFVKQIQLLHVL